jgi:putative RNA 2'-phosphotransferase
MISEKENMNISKFLSLVLRHQPELIGLELDENGWVAVDELLTHINAHGQPITAEILDHVVETNSKKRFAFSDDKRMIRASQGHSVEVNLGYEPQVPPEILYHGTGTKSLQSILASGLEKRSRQHVHLSADQETAIIVGRRHGEPAIFHIMAAEMHRNGYQFFLSANGVWLTDGVPVEFLALKS